MARDSKRGRLRSSDPLPGGVEPTPAPPVDLCCPIPGLGFSPAQVLALAPVFRHFLEEFTADVTRDQFARAALTGLLASLNLEEESPAVLSRKAFEFADAMMAERKAVRS